MALILPLLLVAAIILMIAIWIMLCLLVADTAENYGRNKTTWALWAFINCPIVVIVVLHCAGKTRKQHLKDIVEEQMLIDDMRAKRHAEAPREAQAAPPSPTSTHVEDEQPASATAPSDTLPSTQWASAGRKNVQTPIAFSDMHKSRWRK